MTLEVEKLCELNTVKNLLEIELSDSSKDEVINAIIYGVSRDFMHLSGRGVVLTTHIEYFDVIIGTNKLYLKWWPVDAVEEFKIYQDLDRNFGATTEVDSDYYWLNDEKGEVDLFQRYPEGVKTIKVTYTGGMAVFDAPDAGQEFWTLYPDLNELIAAQVVYEYRLIPNLGANMIRLKQDMMQLAVPITRQPAYIRAALNNSRIII